MCYYRVLEYVKKLLKKRNFKYQINTKKTKIFEKKRGNCQDFIDNILISIGYYYKIIQIPNNLLFYFQKYTKKGNDKKIFIYVIIKIKKE
jgi:hypothetical protein